MTRTRYPLAVGACALVLTVASADADPRKSPPTTAPLGFPFGATIAETLTHCRTVLAPSWAQTEDVIPDGNDFVAVGPEGVPDDATSVRCAPEVALTYPGVGYVGFCDGQACRVAWKAVAYEATRRDCQAESARFGTLVESFRAKYGPPSGVEYRRVDAPTKDHLSTVQAERSLQVAGGEIFATWTWKPTDSRGAAFLAVSAFCNEDGRGQAVAWISAAGLARVRDYSAKRRDAL